MPSFEYLYTMEATGQFDIENIGEFAISCFNDHFEYIMIAKTIEGITQILYYGPIHLSAENFSICLYPKSCKYDCLEYNPKRISSLVKRFVNDTNKNITQVEVIDIKEAYNKIAPIKECMLID